MGAKVNVASAVSVILVVGVVIGTVAVIKNTNGNNDKDNEKNNSTSMKYATDFCAPTSYTDACLKSVEPVAQNSSATPQDYIKAAIQATIEEVKKAMDVARGMSIDQKTDPFHHMAVEDCKQLLEDAIDELQASFSMVGDSELHALGDRVNELLNWLGAVYSYQTSCVDEFEKPEYRSAIENGMVNATQLTHNAVNIVAAMSEVLKAFNIDLHLKPNSGRRLLEVYEMGHDGYPTWFQVADRRLFAAQKAGTVKPNAVVAKDGSGQFKTISAAIAAYPPKFRGRYVIHVKAGVYEEYVTIDKKKLNVFIFGDGAGKTIVTGHKNFGIMKIQTSNTATFNALGAGFMAKGMTFRNTAGPKGHQAVALRVQADRAAIFECNIEGYQDTLYYQTHRQFYRNCVISGSVDFIFGKGTAVIQNSEIIVRKGDPGQFNAVTADGKEIETERTGLVLQNCRIVAGKDLFPVRFQTATYLGRPWKKFCKTVIMETEIGDFIRPEGYNLFVTQPPNTNERTAEYYEFANRGPGARTDKRSTLFPNHQVIGGREAAQYTVENFIGGKSWLPATGVDFTPGFTR